MITKEESAGACENMAGVTADILGTALGRSLFANNLDVNFLSGVDPSARQYTSLGEIPEQDLDEEWSLEASFLLSPMAQCDVVANWNVGIRNRVPEEAWRALLSNCATSLPCFIPEDRFRKLTEEGSLDPLVVAQLRSIRWRGSIDPDALGEGNGRLTRVLRDVFEVCMAVDKEYEDGEGIVEAWNNDRGALESSFSLGLAFDQTAEDEIRVRYLLCHYDDMKPRLIAFQDGGNATLVIPESVVTDENALYDTIAGALDAGEKDSCAETPRP